MRNNGRARRVDWYSPGSAAGIMSIRDPVLTFPARMTTAAGLAHGDLAERSAMPPRSLIVSPPYRSDTVLSHRKFRA